MCCRVLINLHSSELAQRFQDCEKCARRSIIEDIVVSDVRNPCGKETARLASKALPSLISFSFTAPRVTSTTDFFVKETPWIIEHRYKERTSKKEVC